MKDLALDQRLGSVFPSEVIVDTLTTFAILVR